MSVIYRPPYDSPIEDRFAKFYAKYASLDATMNAQVSAQTLCGKFILDFMLEDINGVRVGIECDGKQYHDDSRDEWRDAMILGEDLADIVIRLRGQDIHYVIEDIMHLLARLTPSLFLPNAECQLDSLASQEIKNIRVSQADEIYHCQYLNNSDFGNLYVELRRASVPSNQRRFWQRAYQFAVEVGGGRLDDVIAKYRSRNNDLFTTWV